MYLISIITNILFLINENLKKARKKASKKLAILGLLCFLTNDDC